MLKRNYKRNAILDLIYAQSFPRFLVYYLMRATIALHFLRAVVRVRSKDLAEI